MKFTNTIIVEVCGSKIDECRWDTICAKSLKVPVTVPPIGDSEPRVVGCATNFRSIQGYIVCDVDLPMVLATTKMDQYGKSLEIFPGDKINQLHIWASGRPTLAGEVKLARIGEERRHALMNGTWTEEADEPHHAEAKEPPC